MIINFSVTAARLGLRHRHISMNVLSFASAISIDWSVKLVMKKLAKVTMFKALMNKGMVRIQLQKDSFWLLSNQDLCECDSISTSRILAV